MRQSLLNTRALRSAAKFFSVSLVLAIAAGLISYSVATRVRAAGRQTDAASALPLSAEISTKFFAPNGELANQTLSTYQRFSDGSRIYRSRRVIPSERLLFTQILDRSSEQKIDLEHLTKSVMTTKMTGAEQANLLEGMWEENCPADSEVDTTNPGEVMFGYPTTHITKTFDASWKEERWMITELGCLSVKEVDTSGSSIDIAEVTSLKVGEPPRDLFTVPSNYTERSPQEVNKLYKLLTNEGPLWHQGLEKRLQEEYVSKHAQ